jgi:hypothetical protein
MTSQDILTLAQAGFNQQQIMALVTAMQQPTQPIQQPAMVQQQYQPIQQVQTIPQPQQVQQQYQPFQQVQTVTQNPQVQQVPQPQLVQPIPANLDPVIEQINKLTSAVSARRSGRW